MVKLDLKFMGYITVFEKITRAKVKDCFYDKNNVLIFIVGAGEIGKAIGKKGVNVRKISSVMKKRIKVVEFNPDVCRFVKNCLIPLKVEVLRQDSKVVIKCSSRQDKGIVLGRDKANLNELKEIVSKFFSDIEIIVE